MKQAETVAMFNNPAHKGPSEAFVSHVFATGLPWPSKSLSKKTGKSSGMKSDARVSHPKMGRNKKRSY